MSVLDRIEDRQGAYVLGVACTDASLHIERKQRIVEVRAAIDSWMGARFDHGHTSYWGRAHVDAMCAFWLGRMRALRKDEGVGG